MTAKYPQKIKVAILPFGDTMCINASVEGKLIFSGVEGEILNIVLGSLGFQYDFVIPNDLTWGLEEDGNWSGLVGMVHREEADLAFSYLTITDDRSSAIGFSEPYAYDELTFVSHMPPNRKSTVTFLYPFDSVTWVSLFLTLVFMSILLAMLKNGIRSLGIHFFKLSSNLLSQPSNTDGGSRKYKVLIAFWLLFAKVIILGYSSTLLSFLIHPLKESPIQNFEELSSAVQEGKYQANFSQFALSFLLHSNIDYLSTLGKFVSLNNWIYNTTSLSNDIVIKSNLILALNKNLAKSYFGKRNDLLISDDRLYTVYLAFGYNKHFCCVSELNKIITKISHAGLYGKFLHDNAIKLFLKNLKASAKQRVETSLTIEELVSEFALLLVGLSLSIVVFLAEIAYSRFKREKSSKKLNLAST